MRSFLLLPLTAHLLSCSVTPCESACRARSACAGDIFASCMNGCDDGVRSQQCEALADEAVTSCYDAYSCDDYSLCLEQETAAYRDCAEQAGIALAGPGTSCETNRDCSRGVCSRLSDEFPGYCNDCETDSDCHEDEPACITLYIGPDRAENQAALALVCEPCGEAHGAEHDGLSCTDGEVVARSCECMNENGMLVHGDPDDPDECACEFACIPACSTTEVLRQHCTRCGGAGGCSTYQDFCTPTCCVQADCESWEPPTFGISRSCSDWACATFSGCM